MLDEDLDARGWSPETTTSAGWPRRARSRSATWATRRSRPATFPVIDGVRYSVPGDRARLLADGRIELLGRDSVTINSGGEKIFAEEVEAAIAGHPAVADVVVTGRPSEHWGQEVVAIVQLVPITRPPKGTSATTPPARRPLQAAQACPVRGLYRPLAVGQG